jgi:hypothetical protein
MQRPSFVKKDERKNQGAERKSTASTENDFLSSTLSSPLFTSDDGEVSFDIIDDDDDIGFENKAQPGGRYQEGTMFRILRYPFLLMIIMIVAIELFIYACIRVYVNLHEYFFVWKGDLLAIKKRHRSASSYREWIDISVEMDRYLGNNDWKYVEECSLYDNKLIRRLNKLMKVYCKLINNGSEKRKMNEQAISDQNYEKNCASGNAYADKLLRY